MILKIGNLTLTDDDLPFVIAEAGVNYYDIAASLDIEPLEAAKLMISEAKKAGAGAIKFQTYKAEKLASKNSPAYWDTTKESSRSQYELFRKFDSFGEDEYRELSRYAGYMGIVFLSTPFDFESADYLEPLMPAYKISSSDITNIPFIKHMATKEKPVMLSTGASTLEEIREAVRAIESAGNNDIVLMHCVLSYPTKYEDANLRMILDLKEKFPDYLIGYSDHTPPDENMLVLTTAYGLGAVVLEKHFTLDKSLQGNDHYHSMDSEDLLRFWKNIDVVADILGEREKKPLNCEMPARKNARRSIVTSVKIPKGAVIEREMITFKRPGTGISPRDIDKVIGMRALRDINEDEILTWDLIE